MSNPGKAPDSADIHGRIVAFLPRLRRFCRAIAGSRDTGDDLMQSTVVRALERINQWQEGTSLESWMFRIARNMQLDNMRSARTRGIPVDVDTAFDLQGEDGVANVEARSELRAVRAAMAALPEEQRVLMALVVLDGQSYKEAAEMLEVPIGTVMSRVARARRAIDEHVNGTKERSGRDAVD